MSADEEQQVELIDKELVKSSLYNLGKTFNNARHAYLSLNLSNSQLTTINVSFNFSSPSSFEGPAIVHLFTSNRLIM